APPPPPTGLTTDIPINTAAGTGGTTTGRADDNGSPNSGRADEETRSGGEGSSRPGATGDGDGRRTGTGTAYASATGVPTRTSGGDGGADSGSTAAPGHSGRVSARGPEPGPAEVPQDAPAPKRKRSSSPENAPEPKRPTLQEPQSSDGNDLETQFRNALNRPIQPTGTAQPSGTTAPMASSNAPATGPFGSDHGRLSAPENPGAMAPQAAPDQPQPSVSQDAPQPADSRYDDSLYDDSLSDDSAPAQSIPDDSDGDGAQPEAPAPDSSGSENQPPPSDLARDIHEAFVRDLDDAKARVSDLENAHESTQNHLNDLIREAEHIRSQVGRYDRANERARAHLAQLDRARNSATSQGQRVQAETARNNTIRQISDIERGANGFRNRLTEIENDYDRSNERLTDLGQRVVSAREEAIALVQQRSNWGKIPPPETDTEPDSSAHPAPVPVSEPAPIPGRIDSDGVRRFNSNEEGERYGEMVLDRTYRNLDPADRLAVYEYTRDNWINHILRGEENFAGYVDYTNRDTYTPGNLLFDIVGAERHITVDDIRQASASRSDLNHVQRTIVRDIVNARDPQSRLDDWITVSGRRGRAIQTLDGVATEERIGSHISGVDTATTSMRLPETIEVVRGTHDIKFLQGYDGYDSDVDDAESYAGPDDLEAAQAIIGIPQRDEGYLSTALGVEPPTDTYGSRFIFHFRAPEGMEAIWMGRNSHYPHQRELTFTRDSDYVVTNVEQLDNGSIRLDAVFLLPDTGAGTGPSAGPPRDGSGAGPSANVSGGTGNDTSHPGTNAPGPATQALPGPPQGGSGAGQSVHAFEGTGNDTSHPGTNAPGPVAPAPSVYTFASTPRDFSDNEEAREYGREYWGPYLAAQPNDRLTSVRYYTQEHSDHETSYADINGALREGGPIDPDIGRHISNIDSVLEGRPTNVPLVAYRGTDIDYLPADPPQMVGREFHELGYISASLGGVSRNFESSEAIYRIFVPAEVPAAWTEDLSGFSNTDREILLGRGLWYRIENAGFDDDEETWYMDVVITRRS
ncbi:ADP-ribosyltransferase, partial [Streptomonospora sediminis]